jgi:hypothetical protein
VAIAAQTCDRNIRTRSTPTFDAKPAPVEVSSHPVRSRHFKEINVAFSSASGTLAYKGAFQRFGCHLSDPVNMPRPFQAATPLITFAYRSKSGDRSGNCQHDPQQTCGIVPPEILSVLCSLLPSRRWP